MLRIKNITIIAAVVISGLLLFSLPAFAQWGGNNGNHCGSNDLDYNRLPEEQSNKVEQIHDNYYEKITPLQEELNTLHREVYNYRQNDNADIETIKDYRQEIRDLRGKIDNLRLDAIAEINEVVPEDQRGYYHNYLNDCFGYFNGHMNNGRMGNGMHGSGGHMRGGMMNGSGMHGGGMMNGNMNYDRN